MGRMIRNSSDVITDIDDFCEVGMTKIKIIDSNKEETEFSFIGLGTDDSYIASNSSRMTSDQVKVTSGVFDCSSTGDFNPKTIVIDFTLDQNISPAPRVEEGASINFKTTIETRNY